MTNQELIQKARTIMHQTYCNGITINYDNILETHDEVKILLDFLVPKKVEDDKSEYQFYFRLRNVALIKLSKEGKLISKSDPNEFVLESIRKYGELIKKREKIIIKLFSEYFTKLEQVHIALTPLRKVLRKFYESDFSTDGLNKRFSPKEIKYIKFLQTYGYIRKENDKLTLDNKSIKKLKKNFDDKNRELVIEKLISNIFSEHFEYMIYELNNTSIVPYIGILVTLCILALEIQKNVSLTTQNLFGMYKQHYSSGQNQDSFEDKIVDLKNSNLLDYKDNKLKLPEKIYSQLIKSFSSPEIQKQVC